MKITVFQAGYCTCPEHLAIQGGDWRGIPFPAMFALFEHPHLGPMLFDTGYSYRFFDETRHFPNSLYRWLTPVSLEEDQLAVNQLSSRDLKPSDITHVFISHFHADHISALADFDRARYVYLPQAYEAVRRRRGLGALTRGVLPGLMPRDFETRSAPVDISHPCNLPLDSAPFITGYDLIGDGTLMAVELPGHSVGQMGILAHTEHDEIFFFVADSAWLAQSILEDRPPHKLANYFFSDLGAYRSTLTNLHEYQLGHPDVHVIPSHCAATLARFISK